MKLTSFLIILYKNFYRFDNYTKLQKLEIFVNYIKKYFIPANDLAKLNKVKKVNRNVPYLHIMQNNEIRPEL